jgi:hypothetical protein
MSRLKYAEASVSFSSFFFFLYVFAHKNNLMLYFSQCCVYYSRRIIFVEQRWIRTKSLHSAVPQFSFLLAATPKTQIQATTL